MPTERDSQGSARPRRRLVQPHTCSFRPPRPTRPPCCCSCSSCCCCCHESACKGGEQRGSRQRVDARASVGWAAAAALGPSTAAHPGWLAPPPPQLRELLRAGRVVHLRGPSAAPHSCPRRGLLLDVAGSRSNRDAAHAASQGRGLGEQLPVAVGRQQRFEAPALCGGLELTETRWRARVGPQEAAGLGARLGREGADVATHLTPSSAPLRLPNHSRCVAGRRASTASPISKLQRPAALFPLLRRPR